MFPEKGICHAAERRSRSLTGREPGESRAIQGKVQGDVSLYFCGAPLVCGSIDASKSFSFSKLTKRAPQRPAMVGWMQHPVKLLIYPLYERPNRLSSSRLLISRCERSLALSCGSSTPTMVA